MRELFGTDGVRGIAGQHPLDLPTIYKLGKALVRSGRRKILIGRDTRISGPWIARALEVAIVQEGGEVILADVIRNLSMPESWSPLHIIPLKTTASRSFPMGE